MTNPFDDPQVRAAMAEAGIVHKPGMAAELIEELAPFLADEGIDLDEPIDVDLATLNAALSRATDRYNQELDAPGTSAPARKGSRSGKGSKKSRRASSRAPKRAGRNTDAKVVGDFTAWLEDQPDVAGPSVEVESEMFAELVRLARRCGVDPVDPSDMGDWVAAVLDRDDDELPGTVLAELVTLDEYVHFRLDTCDDDSDWETAHEEVNLALEELRDEDNPLVIAMDEAAGIDLEVRRQAYAKTRVVAMVPRFLEWLGKGRPVTPSQGLRRADIAETAAMLGVTAVGVNKRRPGPPVDPSLFDDGTAPEPPSVIYALSMNDVPELASWWEGLRVAEVIETTATRVRPGPEAECWLAEDTPPPDLAETVIGITLAHLLVHDLWGRDYATPRVAAITMVRLLEAVAPGSEWPEPSTAGLEHLLEWEVSQRLHQLERLGLVEMDEDGGVTIPPALRGAVARGLITASAAIDQTEIDDEDEDEWT